MQRFSVSLLIALAVALTPLRGAAQSVTLNPAVVEAGSPELIRVAVPHAATVEGEWLGRKLQFFRDRQKHAWYALAGADVEAPAGPSTLTILAKDAQGVTTDLSQQVEIVAAHYRTGSLKVAPQFVEPGAEVKQRIAEEAALKEKIFSQSAAQPLWTGSFKAPVREAATDSFGTRRMFNGKLASVHKGMDFRAATGTPVLAGQAGVVVLARSLFYEGNCVVVDHGLGFYTISMHLSRIDVIEGEGVSPGEKLGLSGATGRVTGPHLHWAARWQGAYLDPAKLLKMNLNGLQ